MGLSYLGSEFTSHRKTFIICGVSYKNKKIIGFDFYEIQKKGNGVIRGKLYKNVGYYRVINCTDNLIDIYKKEPDN